MLENYTNFAQKLGLWKSESRGLRMISCLSLLAEETLTAAAPWWVAGALGLISVGVGIGFGVLRLADAYKEAKLKWKSAVTKADTEAKQTVEDQQTAARRDSAEEAWEVVDRFDGEIRRLSSEVQQMRVQHQQCLTERAADKVMLKIMAQWLVKQRKPPPIPPEILKQILADEGSGPHTPLPEGS